jgi:hypothetical protein
MLEADVSSSYEQRYQQQFRIQSLDVDNRRQQPMSAYTWLAARVVSAVREMCQISEACLRRQSVAAGVLGSARRS